MDLKIIEKAMKLSNVNMHKLSKISQVGYATIYDLLNNKITNPRVETVMKITEALNIKVSDVLGEKNEENKSDTKDTQKKRGS